jgi:hypothetical protein
MIVRSQRAYKIHYDKWRIGSPSKLEPLHTGPGIASGDPNQISPGLRLGSAPWSHQPGSRVTGEVVSINVSSPNIIFFAGINDLSRLWA